VLCTRCKLNETDGVRRRCLACLSYMRTYKAVHGRHPDESPTRCRHTDCPREVTPGYKSCAVCRTKALVRSPEQRLHVAEHRVKRQALKMEVFRAYGGPSCACCGEDKHEFLSIDHIDGHGAEHRKQITNNPRNGSNLYHWLKKHDFPSGFRVLCMNCNFAMGHFGYCPHGSALQLKAC
jgi:hypothetical protein